MKSLYCVEKPGTAIHLLKERAKLQRDHSNRKVHHISKRLSNQVISREEEKQSSQRPEKRPNHGQANHQKQKGQAKDEVMSQL